MSVDSDSGGTMLTYVAISAAVNPDLSQATKCLRSGDSPRGGQA